MPPRAFRQPLRRSRRKQAWLKARWGVYAGEVLAHKLGITPQALTYWKHRLGLPDQRRGPRPLDCRERRWAKPGCPCADCARLRHAYNDRMRVYHRGRYQHRRAR